MTIQSRRRRRLAIVALLLLGLGGALTGMYVLRQHQIKVTSEAHRVAGLEAVENGDSAAAMEHLGAYLRRHDDDVDALYQYACARRRIEAPRGQHLTAAIGVLQRVIDLAPEHDQARSDLLDLYLMCGYSHETLDMAKVVIERNPTDSDAWRAKATAEARLGRFQDALESVTKCIQVQPLDLRACVLQLDVQQKLGATNGQLIEIVKEHRKAFPGSPIANLYEAYAHRLAANAATYIEMLRAAAQSPNSDEPYVIMLVMLLDDARLSDEAMSILEKTSKLNDSPVLLSELARRLWETNRFADLEARLSSLDITKRDTSDLLLGLRASALYELDRREVADAITAKLGERGSDSIGAAWAGVLHAAYSLRPVKPHTMVATCNDALSLDPKNPYFAYRCGSAWMALGENDLALSSWKSAIDQRPTWVSPRVNRVHALLAAGQSNLAQREARQVMERAPTRVDATAAWVLAYAATLSREDREGAQNLLSAATAVQVAAPYEPRTLALYIALQAQSGKRDTAIARLKKILEKAPPLDEATWLSLAAVSKDHQLGLEDECYKKIETAWGLTPGLAVARAQHATSLGHALEGKQQLFKAAATAPPKYQLAWKIAIGKYLDETNDPSALDHWVDLANNNVEDARIQNWALQAQCVQRSPQVQDQIIERLRLLSGPRAVQWRLARAKQLLNTNDSNRAAEAASLMQEVISDAPNSLSAQLMLARCLERVNLEMKASTTIIEAARLQPQSIELALEAARILQSQRDFKAAKTYLIRVAQRNDLDARTATRVTSMLGRQGEDLQAIQLLERVKGDGKLEVNQLLLLGELCQRQGDRQRVEAVISQLLESPTASGIQFAAGYRASTNDLEGARKILQRLSDGEVDKGHRALILADFEQRFGSVESSTKHWQEAIDANPSNPVAHRGLISLHLRMGQAQTAIEVLDRTQQLAPENAPLTDLWQRKALVQWAAARPTYVPLLLSMVQNESQQKVAAEGLECIQSMTRETRGQALPRLRTLCFENIDSLVLSTTAAQVHLLHGKNDDALVIANAATAAHPGAWEASLIKCEVLGALGRWGDALATAKAWRQLTGANTVLADITMAQALCRLNRPAEAVQVLAPLIPAASKDPIRNGDILWNYARSLVAAEEFASAEKLLVPLWKESQAWRMRSIDLALQPGVTESAAKQWLERMSKVIASDQLQEQTRLAASWLELSNNFESITLRRRAHIILSELVKVPDATSEQWFLLGMIEEKEPNLVGAEFAYRQALKLTPDMAPACNNLAMILAQDDRRLDEALTFAHRAAKASPSVPTYFDTRAYIEHRMNRFDEALASAQRAVDLQPENPQWRKRLAMVTERDRSETNVELVPVATP